MIHLYQFKITLNRQLTQFVRVPLTWVTIILGFNLFLHIDLISIGFLVSGLLLFALDTLPTIAVHWQYWKANYKTILTIDTQGQKLTVTSPHKNFTYSFNDIAALHYYHSYLISSGFHSFGGYRYYKIIFRDENNFIITSLMINDIEKTLEQLFKIKAGEHAQLISLLD
jgi:hypothetical protein